MAPKENMNQSDQEFADSFNEDLPKKTEPTEDEAFGLALPETPEEMPDDDSGTGKPPIVIIGAAAPIAPVEAEENAIAGENADAPTNEEPVPEADDVQAEVTGSDAPDDGEMDIELERQRLRSWEGRLKAQQAAIDKKADVEDSEAESEAGENSDIETIKAQLREDFGEDFINAICSVARESAKEVVGESISSMNKTVDELIADIRNSRTRRHFEEINDVHPDFLEIYESENFKKWIDGLPGKDHMEAVRIVESGSSREINRLLTQYKEATAAAVTAEINEVAPLVSEKSLDDAEGVRSSGMKLPDPPAPGADDFEKAWNES